MSRVLRVSFLVAVTLLLQWKDVNGKLYNITEGWMNNGSSLQHFKALSGSYTLVSAFPINGSSHHHKEEFVQSDNGLFELAFYNLNGTGYYLSILMGGRNSSSAVPVWTANRGKALSRHLVLKTKNGLLLLQDIDNKIAWSPTIVLITMLQVENTGNLVLYNESGVVWQSFDHPTNVILPGQKLVTGQRLVSNINSSTMSQGAFIVSIEARGIALFVTTSSQERQPYFLWSLQGNSLGSLQQVCPDYKTELQYTTSGTVKMSFIKNVTTTTLKPCGSGSLNVSLGSGEVARYIELMENGELTSYKFNGSSWQADFKLTTFLSGTGCSLPSTCGSYGVCENGGQCKCLHDNEAVNVTFDTNNTCHKPRWSAPTNCTSRYLTDFVNLPGVSYFTKNYVDPDRISYTVEDCLQACKNNCSCSAMVYDKSARNCFFLKDVLGSLSTDQKCDAYLKFQDHSRLAEVGQENVSSSRNLVLILCTVGAALVIILSALLLLWELKRRQKAELARLLIALHGPPQKFTYRRLSRATRNFTKLIGSGGFGSVYEGVFSNGKRFAVKRLHSAKSNTWEKQFIAEVTTMGTVSHINIVKLCGFCAEPSHQLLVYEFMSNGSLDKWIFKAQETPLEWRLRYNIAIGTARGLAYLHEESREPVIHLDIKPQNILLDENFVAKVGDFGMAKLLMSRDVNEVVTGVRGTPGYLAPEWLLHSIATKKCDVYSYGMVLLELIGGRKNLDATNNISWYFPAWAVGQIREGNMLNIVEERIRESSDVEQARRMIEVAFWCIQENPGDRPTMDMVVQMLEGQKEVSHPPLSFHFVVEASGMISIKTTQDKLAVGYSESSISYM